MKKNILLGLLVLLIGVLLGGVFYHLLYEKVEHPVSRPYSPPVVSRKIAQTSKDFSDIVRVVSPSVINISTTRVVKKDLDSFSREPFFDFFDPFHNSPKKWKEQSLGSGVIVSPDGYIVTNNHVIEQAEEIRVTLYDGRTFMAKVVGVDTKTDLALIRIKAKNLPTIPWGDSRKLSVGEFVLAIGNPFGLSNTVTMGIVSAVGRANVGIADYEDFIQTDAAINPGNSGGPLVNIKGELVGINTAIFSRSGGYQGIGFAVPSNMARTIIEQLREKGRVVRGWIGVTIQDLTPELARNFGLDSPSGALVSDVFRGSPAEKAGIRRGDIIVEFSGEKIPTVSTLRNMVAQSRVGHEVVVKLIRNRKKMNFKIKIAELPDEFTEIASLKKGVPEDENPLSGLTVAELTNSIARQLGINPAEGGVVVVSVEEGSPPERAGIKKGDLIQEVDRRRVQTYEDWKDITSALRGAESVVVFLNREGRRFYVAVKP